MENSLSYTDSKDYEDTFEDNYYLHQEIDYGPSLSLFDPKTQQHTSTEIYSDQTTSENTQTANLQNQNGNDLYDESKIVTIGNTERNVLPFPKELDKNYKKSVENNNDLILNSNCDTELYLQNKRHREEKFQEEDLNSGETPSEKDSGPDNHSYIELLDNTENLTISEISEEKKSEFDFTYKNIKTSEDSNPRMTTKGIKYFTETLEKTKIPAKEEDSEKKSKNILSTWNMLKKIMRKFLRYAANLLDIQLKNFDSDFKDKLSQEKYQSYSNKPTRDFLNAALIENYPMKTEEIKVKCNSDQLNLDEALYLQIEKFLQTELYLETDFVKLRESYIKKMFKVDQNCHLENLESRFNDAHEETRKKLILENCLREDNMMNNKKK